MNHPQGRRRGWLVGLATLFILPAGWGLAQESPAPVPAPHWTEAERARLDRYARATWRSFEAMADGDGLPADRLTRDDAGDWKPSGQTTPTDIGAYLWSALAAERLGIIDGGTAEGRLGATLATLERAERHRGFFFNVLDVRTGRPLGVPGKRGEPSRPFLSTVDNGWLAAALTMVRNTTPALRDRADALLAPMDFGFFFEPFDPADPVHHPGQFHGGYFVEDRTFTAFYGMLATEPRIVSYLAIARGQVPPAHYYRLFRTLPTDRGRQKAIPRGESRTYLAVPVFEGYYEVDGAAVVPSWGGSMFEALMVPLFVPEARWAPRSWGVNHPLHVRTQIRAGLDHHHFGAWGFSPCEVPEGGYGTFGVPSLGATVDGYHPFETGPGPHDRRPAAGVVTPHASFLALAFAPREALSNLDHLERTYPIFGAMGFHDSVNVATGAISPAVLALDQGMILAAIANAAADDAMLRAFSGGAIEGIIRPLIAPEVFSAHPAP